MAEAAVFDRVYGSHQNSTVVAALRRSTTNRTPPLQPCAFVRRRRPGGRHSVVVSRRSCFVDVFVCAITDYSFCFSNEPRTYAVKKKK